MMILAFQWSAGLFAAGGTDLNGKGHKWLRRFVMPIGLGCASLISSSWYQALAYAVLLSAVLHIGYGDRCSWTRRIAIFIGYGAVSLVFGWSYWVVITPVLLSLLFLASNWKPLANTVFWKSVELLMGALISISFIGAINNAY
jgi:hypothetical protein